MGARGSASIACPHCRSGAAVRTSRIINRLNRELHLQCTDVDCGHTFAAVLSITHTISPSAQPDPTVQLAIAPPRKLGGNDNDGVTAPKKPDLAPAASNDDACARPPATAPPG